MAVSLPSRRFRYMTARCPHGCGWWSIPAAVRRHTASGRCTGVPWPLAHPSSLLVPAGTRTALLAALPARVKHAPSLSDRAVAPLTRDRRLPRRVVTGVVVVSPLAGVGARRWLETVAAGVRRRGNPVINQAMTTAGYAAVEAEVGPVDGYVTCDVCGEWTTPAGAARHRAGNTRCRWLAAHLAVEQAWAAGWRDPWSLRDETSPDAVPNRWAELSHGRWRRFVRLVVYPQWTAVLVDPAQRLRPDVPARVGAEEGGR